MGQWVVNQHFPANNKQQEGSELHPLSHSACHQQRGDRREHRLERSERQSGDGGCELETLCAQTVHEEVLEIADESTHVLSVDKRETTEVPEHLHRGQADEHLRNDGERVLPAQQPCFEKRKSGHHTQHENGTQQDPGGISFVRAFIESKAGWWSTHGLYNSAEECTSPYFIIVTLNTRSVEKTFFGPISAP